MTFSSTMPLTNDKQQKTSAHLRATQEKSQAEAIRAMSIKRFISPREK